MFPADCNLLIVILHQRKRDFEFNSIRNLCDEILIVETLLDPAQ